MTIGSSHLLGSLLVLLGWAAAVAGQQAPAAPPDADVNKDDVLILVNLTADELRYEAVPNPTVTFPGTHKRTTFWVTDRFNLPDRLEPGVTYRNFGITLRISSRFADIERIVREALGEIPVDDATPETSTEGPAGPSTSSASIPLPLTKPAPSKEKKP